MADPVILASVEELLEALGQDQALVADNLPHLSGAIVRSTTRIAGKLRTALYRERVVDLFHCDSTRQAALGKHYRFLLANGCIRKDVPVVVSVSGSEDGPWSEVTAKVDYDKGVVMAKELDVEGLFVQVSYESGFGTKEEVPYEIKHAILISTPLMVLSSNSATLEPKQQAASLAKANSLDSMSDEVVVPFMRHVGATFKPLFTARESAMPPIPPTP